MGSKWVNLDLAFVAQGLIAPVNAPLKYAHGMYTGNYKEAQIAGAEFLLTLIFVKMALPPEAPKSPAATGTLATGAAASSNVANILKPGGQLIGKAGSSSNIRIVEGTAKEAQQMFNTLTKGGKVLPKSTYPGKMAELPGGGRIGYRPVSKSGPPTIDVHDVPGLPNKMEIKFKE